MSLADMLNDIWKHVPERNGDGTLVEGSEEPQSFQKNYKSVCAQIALDIKISKDNDRRRAMAHPN